ncbi:acyltransferase [Secundilactobacillus yichangensis]|uniref:acyltransferase n=1 Tax=Secundilactobacillus yichangensis TaxID=2799580 RepID=UPI0019404D7B|nr:acyltransferase [Secundilactobacillus yichangensis]
MTSINSRVSKYTKFQIYFSTLIKLLRGYVRGLFLKKHSGPLFIGKKVKIINSQYISTGRNVKFEDFSEIQGLSERGIVFKDNVTIGRNVMVRPSSYYGVGHIGDTLQIGNNSSIGPGGYIGAAGKIIIGENVMIGPNVTMIAENHIFSDSKATIKSQGVEQQGITIESNVWIGTNVVILDGVKIGQGSVIGAGTLVTKSIPAYSRVFDRRAKDIVNRK